MAARERKTKYSSGNAVKPRRCGSGENRRITATSRIAPIVAVSGTLGRLRNGLPVVRIYAGSIGRNGSGNGAPDVLNMFSKFETVPISRYLVTVPNALVPRECRYGAPARSIRGE